MKAVDGNVKIGSDESNRVGVLEAFIAEPGNALDFISFHRYGTSSATEADAVVLYAAENRYLVDTSAKYSPDTAVALYKNARGVTLPVYVTESNVSSSYGANLDPRSFTIFAAVYHALSMRAFLMHGVSAACYFTFGGAPQGMGMVSFTDKKQLYPYYFMRMLGQNLSVGDLVVYTENDSPDIQSMAWRHGNELKIMIISKTHVPQSILLGGVAGTTAQIQVIDESYPNDAPVVQQAAMVDLTKPFTMRGMGVAILSTGAKPSNNLLLLGLLALGLIIIS
jgi:hypothetical protein